MNKDQRGIQLKQPELDTNKCLELSYLFVCLMYGHWKMVATLGYAEEHKYITRRAIDRLLQSYLNDESDRPAQIKPWAVSDGFAI